jgi:hypothetical protein
MGLPARGATCAVALVLLFGWASPAGAQSIDPAAAQALFDEGRALLDKGDFDAACPKLAASQHLDPAVGTLLSLGQCELSRGRTASAWLAYREATSLATGRADEKRKQFASGKAAALEPRLGRIVVRVPTAAPGLTVRRDGVVVDPAMFGTAAPTDPGPHVMLAEAPGRQAWTSTVSVAAEGGTLEVVVPPLDAAAPETPASDAHVVAAEGSNGRATRHIIALAVGGAGLVGVGVGAGFGIATIAKWHDVAGVCPSGVCPNQFSLDREGAAKTSAASSATLSTVFFVVGGAALAAGVVLWFTAPSNAAGESQRAVGVVPIVGAGTGGAAVLGRF